ncbi:LytR/AlgR family response regulator transcription factor [Streptosporangium sp. NBC_01469]|uniref:LytR/AlgR family response regulator transcription factor n=1 Tax=Streptosporangium sp. NBC_01469 TaxID=2903898 RepID=UPI002E2A9A99|nr:response regulator transcription factor [Streptosporangium sp. NBC_01469]
MAIRCLIVDDNDHFRSAARALLEGEGITVVGTASASGDALRQIDDVRPDVALVDIDLGEENGFEVARRLVAVRLRPPRVILISTYAEKDFAEMIAVSPAIAFLSKSALSGAAIREILWKAGGEGDLDGPVRLP